MKPLFAAIACALFLSAAAQEAPSQKISFTTLRGKEYKEVTVTKNYGDSIQVTHAGGIARIDFADLPEAIRAGFGYDPNKAAAVRDQRAQAAAQTRKSQLAALAKKQEKNAYARANEFSAEILQVLPNGLLLNGVSFYQQGAGPYTDSSVFFLELNPDSQNLHDGKRISFRAYVSGTFRYTTALGSESTVQRLIFLPNPG